MPSIMGSLRCSAAFVFTTSIAFGAASAASAAEGDPAGKLVYPAKPAQTTLAATDNPSVITVKFKDGLRVRLRDGALTDLGTGVLKDAAPTLDAAAGGAGVLAGATWRKAHDLAEEKLDELRVLGERNIKGSLPDLNLQFELALPANLNAATVCDALNALAVVELAQPVPLPVLPPTAPSFQSQQGYLNAAVVGIGASAMWPTAGGTGTNVRVCDIEYSWNFAHVDLPPITRLGPVPVDPFNDLNHGTAVMGVICSKNNNSGTTGAAYGVTPYVAAANTASGYNVGAAITNALGTLRAGDVIIIEQQLGGPDGGQYVPVEWFRPYYDAIRTAVAAGVTVVEAAGNGNQNLDGAIFQTGHAGFYPFTPEQDSGAIIVGAGAAPAAFSGSTTDRSRLGFSNYGSTVDLQGWGERVTTCAYGDRYSSEGVNAWYTSGFNGTSSASPVVTSAVAILQSIAKQSTGAFLFPVQVRDILRSTGSPQQAGANPVTQNIGPRPNLVAAVEALGSGFAPAILAQPTTVSAARFGNAVVNLDVIGTPPFTFAWRHNNVSVVDGPSGASIGGGTVSGTNSSDLRIEGVTATDAGAYEVTITNPYGQTTSATITLSVVCDEWLSPGVGADLDNTIYALALFDPDGTGPLGPRIVAGGSFLTAGGATANRIAMWDGAGWLPMGDGFNNIVNALAVLPNGQLIAGGAFTMSGTTSVSRIAAWNGTAWSPLGLGVNSTVNALAVRGNGDLIVGGSFSQAGGSAAGRIARWNGSAWDNMGSTMTGLAVFCFATAPNGDLIVGGNFTGLGGVAANYVIRWDGTNWSALGAGVDSLVRAAAVMPNGDVIIGGQFITAGGLTVNRLARWNGAQWSGFGDGCDNTVFAVIPWDSNGTGPRGTDIVIGGDFTALGPDFIRNLARWNGSEWDDISGDFNNTVRALLAWQPTALSNELAAGGTFMPSTEIPSSFFARYAPGERPEFASPPGEASAPEFSTAMLSATPAVGTGIEPIVFSWMREGVPVNDGPGGASPGGGTVSGASGVLAPGQPAVLHISAVRASDEGFYSCVITNSCRGLTSPSAHLAVTPACPGDTDGSGTVGLADIASVIQCWNQPASCNAAADIDHDNTIGLGDIAVIIQQWGHVCP
ncbi:MAG TPA: S8 family serine peptidase [Phycisphaerales bacterium]|nr:S8 family serine peptidase [Phycisphaerales bacterium]